MKYEIYIYINIIKLSKFVIQIRWDSDLIFFIYVLVYLSPRLLFASRFVLQLLFWDFLHEILDFLSLEATTALKIVKRDKERREHVWGGFSFTHSLEIYSRRDGTCFASFTVATAI